MLAQIVAMAALCCVLIVAAVLGVARLQLRKVDRMLAEHQRLDALHAAQRQERDRTFGEAKATLRAASDELRTAVAEASRLADERIASAPNVFAKRHILRDKLKLLEFQRPTKDGFPTESMAALAEEFRARAVEVRQFAKRFEY